MKKNIIIFISLLLAATSCIERNPGHFQDISGVYFNNTSDAVTVSDSLDVTFVYTAGDVMEVPVKVQLLGRTAQEDRPVAITVSSDTPALGIADVGNTLIPEDKLPTGLGSLGDGVVDLAIQGRHLDLRAQGCLGKGNRHLAQNIHIVPLENGMALDENLYQQVTVGTAVGAHTALTPDTDALAVVHTGRDLDLDPIGAANLALALTGVAGGLDDLAPSGAGRTGGSGCHLHAHEILDGPDLAGAAALGTGLDDTVGAAAAGTCVAIFDPLGGNLLVTAKGCFLEGQLQPGYHIFTPAGIILGRSSAAAAATEDITEDVAQITEVAETVSAAVAAGAGAVVGIHSGMTELVIAGALLIVGQDFVGLTQFLELLLGGLVAGVPVRVILHGAFPVGLLYFISAGSLLDTQHLIVIAFVFCHMVTSISQEQDEFLRYIPQHQCESQLQWSPAGLQR